MTVGRGLMLRGQLAPPERTLLDVLAETVARYPDAPAIDDGRSTLSYAQLAAAVEATRARLVSSWIAAGERIGIRLRSGTAELYTSILGVLAAGAAYVPVDLDDPQERADLVFGEARVAAVLAADTGLQVRRTIAVQPPSRRPTPDDDAWVIFTSGSTGTPKGVAVSHRSAAAFVDAEARLFLTGRPLGPGDRVLAGLSVAFDASCEEMWLAWRHGACLVPAPRALVRTGMDLGPWLVAQQVTAVSTVPTLASLWQPAELAAVRLLIFGGEACPPELAERLVTPEREVWNTYGPTEATVVACGARLTGEGPVRIGHPLDGWDLAVVDGQGEPVTEGGTGELIIGGVGLARYLDPAKDAEKFAPMPTLGWDRAYRSGDLVRFEAEGLVFVGRGDDQVKLGGRRIELGEVDAALQALPGVAGAAAAVRMTAGGHQVLVGYLAPAPDPAADDGALVELDLADLARQLRGSLPAALVPRLVTVDAIPTRTSGKVDRDALPWPVGEPEADAGPAVADGLTGTQAWLAGVWADVLGARVSGPRDDFFALGGGSLAAALMVSRLRARFPEVTVADVYENPTLRGLAETLDEYAPAVAAAGRTVAPVPRRAQLLQALLSLPLAALEGLRWLFWLALLNTLAAGWAGAPWAAAPWAGAVPWGWLLAGWLLLVTPVGRMGMTVLVARLLLRGIRPGAYRRGGSVHLRLWFTEAFASASGAENLSGAPWMVYYARALGAKIGRGVHLHAIPPVTGLLTLGQGCAVEPEVDLTGHWLDGDVLHLGRVRVGAGASVGARSTLAPGSRVGQDAEVAPGSFVTGAVPPDELWAGSPAVFAGIADRDWPARRPPRARAWVAGYGLTAMALGAVPLLAIAAGLALIGWAARGADLAGLPRVLLVWTAPAALLGFVVYAAVVVAAVRLLGIGLREGHHPVRSRVGWQAWSTERLLDDARTWLFPLYASLFTPHWLRLLGADIGRGVEASTVLLLPRMTKVGDHAFLADDTMIGSYELRGGWIRIDRAKVGKRAFLGNSGMTAPGRRLPKDSLVAVLSAAPQRAKAGSSWLGSPPVQMRRSAQDVDQSRTFAPPRRLRAARAAVELARGLPVVCTAGLGTAVLLVLQQVADASGWGTAALLAGPVLVAAGAVAALTATLAKWLLVGRIAVQERPLWSSFVWRNELADTFVELLAVPWFVRVLPGTPMLNLWLRSLGARIGRGVWCESHWLPEADLVRLGDGATVNRGCVLQTHLFHDRIMSIDGVTLEEGATIGPHGVILPAASIGAGSTVGPASLVMRGEAVPAHSRWTGNPISAWTS